MRGQADLPIFVRIEAGEDTGSSGTAHCLGSVGIAKQNSFACQAIDIWRRHIVIAVAAEVRAIVLGYDEENVGSHGYIVLFHFSIE